MSENMKQSENVEQPEKCIPDVMIYGINFADPEVKRMYEKMIQDPSVDHEGFPLVSPLGPLTESFAKPFSERNQELRAAMSNASSSVAQIRNILSSVRPLNTPEVLRELNKNASSCSKSQTTQITFQHEPAEAEERFRIVKVENVIANRDLPMLYIYGSPAAYYTRPFVTGGQNGTYLFVRYKEDSRKYIIGMSNVDKTELAWIIKTMKMAGSALINIRKQVAKTQAKKGKTFTVSI